VNLPLRINPVELWVRRITVGVLLALAASLVCVGLLLYV
jgi:hypothetical protein